MVVSVARCFNWTPTYIHENLYCDKLDYFGLEFWYNDVKEQNKKINNT